MLSRVTLIRPIINEKSMNLIGQSFYTFQVDKDATKEEVKKIVAEKFKVHPLVVRMVNLHPIRKQQRNRRGYFIAAGMKKAIVKVKPGEKIAIFEQAPAEEEVEVKTAEGEVVAKTKEKKSLLKGTKVKIEQNMTEKKEKIAEEGQRGGKDLKTSHKESKKKGVK